MSAVVDPEKAPQPVGTQTQTQRDVDAVSIQSEDVGHEGVKTVQATHRVFGRYSKWALFVSLGLAAYIYSLDGTTTYAYLAFAVSSFGRHSFISTIQVAQGIIVAVGKPVIAKIADVRSRGFAYVFVLIFYVVGYIVIASAKNAESIAGGIIVYSVGYTGLQLLTQIIIADITTLKWRALVSASMSLPFVINAFVGSNISTNMLEGAGWRWGYGMFAILVPAALAPLIGTLVWAEWAARRRGYIVKSVRKDRTVTQRLASTAQKLDVVGLALLGTSVALILLPMTLARSAEGGWRNPSMIAMEVVGIVLLPVYFLYSAYLAKVPVVPKRFLRNRSVVLACLVGAFDFISFYISYTYLYSFVLIVKPWPLIHATYFAQTQTVALTVFAIVAGVIARFTRRYKAILIAGLAIRLLGAGLMIHSRGANASDAEVVWSQLLQGIGGGFAAVMAQTGAQASVKHADTAMVTAVVLLVTEIGGSIGSAIGTSGSIWTSLMPDKLEQYLPFVDAETRAQLFGSLYVVAAEPRGSPLREGVIMAYDDVMKILCIAATAFAVPPLLMAFFMPDWYLGEGQNAVEGLGLDGHTVEDAQISSSEESEERKIVNEKA
ncbi:ferrichrome-type siderophore transporter [Coprinellus micaceus]|uniref:Ferrichrome-type siderophore transporter n=1 Tax=Coprinellus micaceus TaxID=71717 RepID=A0A4Y7SE91_COPMI|nr:ferrichrome-type siderophore transporter [Coprinellus micaceus]